MSMTPSLFLQNLKVLLQRQFRLLRTSILQSPTQEYSPLFQLFPSSLSFTFFFPFGHVSLWLNQYFALLLLTLERSPSLSFIPRMKKVSSLLLFLLLSHPNPFHSQKHLKYYLRFLSIR